MFKRTMEAKNVPAWDEDHHSVSVNVYTYALPYARVLVQTMVWRRYIRHCFGQEACKNFIH